MVPLLATACSGVGESPAPEPAAKTSAPVIDGVTDHTNIYPYMAQYVWDTGSACSGILVTPGWMLTANHCVTGDPQHPDPNLIFPCYDCGNDLRTSNLMVVYPGPDELGQMDVMVTPSGVREARGMLSGEARSALLNLASLDQALVPAAEPIGFLDQAQAGQASMRAIIVGKSTGTPMMALRSTGLRGTFEAGHLLKSGEVGIKSGTAPVNSGPGAIQNEEGLVFSAGTRELYRFGGTEGNGHRRSAWTYSIQTQTWTETQLHPAKAPDRVLASTFRHDDGAVYEVDRGGLMIRLRRWVPGSSRFETMARWPAPWGSFKRYWLVNGERGELFLVGSRDGQSVIARFSPGADGSLRFRGLREIRDTILLAPVASPTHIGFTVRAAGDSLSGGGLRQESLPISSIGRWLGGWCPGMGDD